MAIGKQIRHYREKMQWKLERLSQESGVDIGTISALEMRDSKRSQFFVVIAKAFRLTLEQLADEGTDHDVLGLQQSKDPFTFSSGRAEVAVTKAMASEAGAVPKGNVLDSWTLEAVNIMGQLDSGQKQAMVAKMREYKQYLGPPRDGHTLSMAA